MNRRIAAAVLFAAALAAIACAAIAWWLRPAVVSDDARANPPAPQLPPSLPKPQPLPPLAGWLGPDHPFVSGETRVTVEGVGLGTVGGRVRPADSGKPALLVAVRIANGSDVRKVDVGRLSCQLTDDIGNEYRRADPGFIRAAATSLYPGQQTTETLAFEPPVSAAKELRLEVIADAFGAKGVVRFRFAPP